MEKGPTSYLYFIAGDLKIHAAIRFLGESTKSNASKSYDTSPNFEMPNSFIKE